MAFIYKITNDINNKIYVGKTSDTIDRRFKKHILDSRKERYNKRPLYDAMNKYGVEHFHVEQLEECSCDLASEREIYWINELDSYRNGYNATYGGDGKHYTDYNLIYNLWQQGLNVKQIQEITKYSGKTIRIALKENGVTSEQRSIRGRSALSKETEMLNKDTDEVIKIFSSVNEAARFLGNVQKSRHIQEVCTGQRKTAYGYKWKFSSSNQ